MPLLVPNIGEQESLRYLVNHSHNIPRNLILKLLSNGSATAWGGPAETDTPASLRTATFVEPYQYASGATAAANLYGYPTCDAPYANQYGKLLDGSNWTCTAAEGTDTTTAQYPEQTFTFTAGSTYIHGYYVARANSIQQLFLNNLTGAVTVAANAALTGTASAATATGGPNGFATNTLGSPYVQVNPVQQYTYSSGGGFNISTITMSATPTGVAVGQYAVGTNIGPYARVTAVNGTTISLSVPSTGTPAGTISFYEGRWAQGQDISGTGIQPSTTIVGYDPSNGIITLSQNANATVSGTVTAAFKAIAATAHGGIPGDVVYLARQTGNTTLVTGSYIINHVDANSFETIPAINNTASTTGGANGVVIYDSIMFLERFTNGPYFIQNNGDQIKITLNVSLS